MKIRFAFRRYGLTVVLIAATVLSGGLLTACGSVRPDGKTVTLTVFAAASLTETLNKAAAVYTEQAPNVKIEYRFDSSGALQNRIEAGESCDLFFSAGQSQMDVLEQAGLLAEDTRRDLLKNQVVLIVPKGEAHGISNFTDAAGDKVSHVAVGGTNVSVGQYAQQIFSSYGLWEQLQQQNKLVFADTSRDVITRLEAGEADCGVLYQTDTALSENVEIAAVAPPAACDPILYPAAVLKNSGNGKAAQRFLEFLQSETCRTLFEDAGFSVIF